LYISYLSVFWRFGTSVANPVTTGLEGTYIKYVAEFHAR